MNQPLNELDESVSVEGFEILKNADGQCYRFDAVNSDKLGKVHFEFVETKEGESTAPGSTTTKTQITSALQYSRTDASSPWGDPHPTMKMKTVTRHEWGAVNGVFQDVTITTEIYDENDVLKYAAPCVQTSLPTVVAPIPLRNDAAKQAPSADLAKMFEQSLNRTIKTRLAALREIAELAPKANSEE